MKTERILLYRNNTSKRTALDSVLICMALILSYIEAVVPLNLIIPLPGFKLGFSNIAVMFAIYYIGNLDAFFVMISKIVITSVLFGSFSSFLFSFFGGILSFAFLLFVRRFFPDTFSWVGISLICAALHNLGQLAAAALVFSGTEVFYYMPLLLLFGLICGIITGLIINGISYIFEKISYCKFTKGGIAL